MRFYLFIYKLNYLHAEIVLEQVDTHCIVVTRFALTRAYIDFTPFTRPTVRTLTRERVNAVKTFAVVHARVAGAIVDILFTHLSGVTGMTNALVIVIQVQTLFCALWATRVAQTFVNSGLTLKTQESRSATAHESVQHVDARSSVLTRSRGTVVDQMLTFFTGVANVTSTRITVDQIRALAVVAARVAGTIVNVDFTSSSGPSWVTHALMAEQFVNAYAVLTRVCRAYFYFRFTTFAREARGTSAFEIVDEIGASSSQETRSFGAVVDVHITMFAFPAGFTFTFVSALFQRCTSSRILTWVYCFHTRINL